MSLATLAGARATSVRLSMPAWGRWYADVSLDGEKTIAPGTRVELVVADLSLRGTVLSGGPYQGRATYRVVAGAGGWGKPLPAWSYQDDAGVKVATILGDAAAKAGETLGPIPATMRVGPSFARRKDEPASRVLAQLVPGAWYVDEDGFTRIGRRTVTPLSSVDVTVESVDRARSIVRVASESIAKLVPGVIVEGIEAVDVHHELTPDGLRTTLWGKVGTGESREMAALRKLFEQLDPTRAFRGVYEYRVVTLAGKRVNLQPERVSIGMPDLERVPIRPGVAGCEADLVLGACVLVAFVNGDPSRPVVVSFDDPDSEGFLPHQLRLAGGADFVAMAAKVTEQLDELKSALTTAEVGAADGGAVYQTNIGLALAAWPGSVGASKVKAS